MCDKVARAINIPVNAPMANTAGNTLEGSISFNPITIPLNKASTTSIAATINSGI